MAILSHFAIFTRLLYTVTFFHSVFFVLESLNSFFRLSLNRFQNKGDALLLAQAVEVEVVVTPRLDEGRLGFNRVTRCYT